MAPRWLGAALVVSTSAVLITVPIARSGGDPESAPDARATIEPSALDQSPSEPQRPPTPPPDETEREFIDSATATSADLRAFLSGASYSVIHEVPWYQTNPKEQIGIVQRVRLSRKITTRMAPWPVLVWEETGSYRRFRYNAIYKNVTTASLYISYREGLVSIAPGPESETIPGEGNDWLKTLPSSRPN